MKKLHTSDKIGDLLLDNNFINEDQLKQALKVQTQSGGHLGSILFELGYVDIDNLQDLLGKQYGVPTANLYKLAIEPKVLQLLSFAKMKEYRVLPLAANSKAVLMAMMTPSDQATIKDLEFIVGKRIQPVVMPEVQIVAALKMLESQGGTLDQKLVGKDLKKFESEYMQQYDPANLKQLFYKLVEENASDLLLSAGVPPCIKKDNELKRLSTTFLTPQEISYLAYELMSPKQSEDFELNNELDFAYTLPEIGRFRVNIYRQRNSISISIRHINDSIPGIDSLGLPPWVEDFALKPQGLILITGPTGHGKSTTLASLIDVINSKRKCNIITIEDPIEFHHKHKSSNVNQREVGVDTDSFHEGLKHIFRQSPDVIVIGEMRDAESFAIAVQAAETGHLVMSTMHSNNATSAIERLIDVFPPQQQQQIRVQLSESFLLVLNQRLIKAKDGKGRILACEKLVSSIRTKNLIREGKTHQIRTMLQQASDDFESIDIALAKLSKESKISQDDALKYCDNPTYLKQMISR